MDLSQSAEKLTSIVEKLSHKVVELNNKVSSLEAEFKSAVKRREAEAYAEAASAAASAIFSIFSGGFQKKHEGSPRVSKILLRSQRI